MTNRRNRQVVVTRHGGPDVMELVDDELPEPGGQQARVRVLAAGVSAFDLIYRRWGRLPGSPKLPFTLGEDIVGVVDAVGPQVRSLSPGQLVAGGTWSLPSVWAADTPNMSACGRTSWWRSRPVSTPRRRCVWSSTT